VALDSKYNKANLKTVVQGAKHLNDKERDLLYHLLIKYEDIFDGTLGEWRTSPVDFELTEGAQLHSQRHYPVPHLYKQTFKKELDRLEGLGVLEKVQQSEWGSPTFIVPKKDRRVRFVSDFRQLNQKLKRKPNKRHPTAIGRLSICYITRHEHGVLSQCSVTRSSRHTKDCLWE
jgi:hypothetical protein